MSLAGFGWEISNLHNNGADVYFRVEKNMTLNSMNIDVAFMVISLSSTGFAEVLCYAGVSRGTIPTFNNSGGHAYVTLPSDQNFGSVTNYNPNGLNISKDPTLSQDKFYAVSLKSWVPSDGSASSSSRQVLANPSLRLNAGDYLVFHMDHAAVGGTAEMQVVLQYTLG